MDRPTRTFDQFFAHLEQFEASPGTVIDVGAARGTAALHDAYPDAYFVLVEPLEEFQGPLREILTRYDGELHHCALMEKAGERSILRTDVPYASSLMHTREEGFEKLQAVNVSTLDLLIGGRPLPEPYLLKIDCQGADFTVVQGGVETLKKCDVVIMEISLFQFWGAHHPKPLEILRFMDANGFAIYDLLDGLYRPLDNALGQLDFVFVKKDSVFRRQQHWG